MAGRTLLLAQEETLFDLTAPVRALPACLRSHPQGRRAWRSPCAPLPFCSRTPGPQPARAWPVALHAHSPAESSRAGRRQNTPAHTRGHAGPVPPGPPGPATPPPSPPAATPRGPRSGRTGPPPVLDLTATPSPQGRRSWSRRCWSTGKKIWSLLLLVRKGGGPGRHAACRQAAAKPASATPLLPCACFCCTHIRSLLLPSAAGTEQPAALCSLLLLLARGSCTPAQLLLLLLLPDPRGPSFPRSPRPCRV
jgi:hypothetical protein